ncbi:type III polyketide synthase [Chthonobacter rhizosphaerae]|uniref:type III polyketide synthase n=1 Tax=Chthonobacter rhizosphaerae TaxID=2735553 RepID=UPI0015EE83D5|nr:type III polyketide synthase [Chthonobacter rhizosphaerae]
MTAAYLNRVGHAVPPHDVHQTFIAFAERMLATNRDRALFRRMAERGQIEHRWSALRPNPSRAAGASVDDGDFFRPGAFPSTGARMIRYEETAPALAEEAVRALDLEGRESEVTHLIVVTCTGFMAPGLDLLLVDRLGLRPDIERTVVGFMGCHAAMNALRLARHVVRSEPSARVLVVSVELCTLHLQESADLEQVLSFLVFGDGAAAALVSGEPHGLALDAFQTILVSEDPGLITWSVRDAGFDMVLSGKVPGALRGALETRSGRFTENADAPIEHWAVHPGGRSVLDAVEAAFRLPAQALGASRAVLREFGNMSSATILFVLARMMAAGREGPGLAMAFGPGLTAETMRFRLVGGP